MAMQAALTARAATAAKTEPVKFVVVLNMILVS